MKGKMTISRSYGFDNPNPIHITIDDKDAVIEFAEISMSLENYALMLTGLANVECEIEVRGLENVGKIREGKELIVELPDGTDWKDRDEIAKKEVIKQAPKGWSPSLYFNSQNSFFRKGDKEFARTHIYRWTERNNES